MNSRSPLTLILLTLSALAGTMTAQVTCVDLRAEFLTDPIGLDRDQPRLNWRVEGQKRGDTMAAFRIIAASSLEKLQANEAELWDSEKIDDLTLLYRRFGGMERKAKPLVSNQQVFWKVMAWDQTGQAGPWSKPATFTMAMVNDTDWKAPWISVKSVKPLPRHPGLHLPPPRYYRKEFSPTKKIKRALAHATAQGIYELHLNGKKVGDAYFAPGWSDYRIRSYFNTYDVTSQLQGGSNCLGAIVADGWFAGYLGKAREKGFGPNKIGRNLYGKTPSLSVQLDLIYEDGSTESILTDETWQVNTGPETEADLQMGEAYDASLEIPGWSKPGFDASEWPQAILAEKQAKQRAAFTDGTGNRSVDLFFKKPGLLEAYPAQPIRITQELAAKAITNPRDNVWVFDFGQNFAGNVRLKVKGEKGQKIVLNYGETILPSGKVFTKNQGKARCTDTYICKGDPNGETWTPRFTYHGFRYAQLTGLKEEPPIETLTGLVIHNDLALTSSFECSDPALNKMFQNAVWTMRSNTVDVPTARPQGDDRMGWLGEGQLSISTGCYHMDARAFYGKWMRDLQECRTKEGYYPHYAPFPFSLEKDTHATAWSDGGIITPFVLWRVYGERQVVQNRWFTIDRYMKARLRADPKQQGIAFGATWGDRGSRGVKTPHEFIDLCYTGLDVRLMMQLAVITGGPIVFNTYSPILNNILKSFREQYINEDGSLKVKTQTAHVLALRFGLVPLDYQAKVAKDLVDLIRAQKGLTTGLLGTRNVLSVLSRYGHHDEAMRLVQLNEAPAWMLGIDNDATTSWENWSGIKREPKGPKPDDSASLSFAPSAAVSEWMLSTLAGIASGGPGFKAIYLEPHIPTGKDAPTWARAHYDSPRGRISAYWIRKPDGSLLYEATIPAGSIAILKLPGNRESKITEGGKAIPADSPHVRFVPDNPNPKQMWYHLQPGSYRFEVK